MIGVAIKRVLRMTVSKEDIRNAYRFILGRDPENESVYETYRDFQDIASLRASFLESDEFKSKQQPNRFAVEAAKPVQIQTDCSPQELQQLFDRIALEWNKFGESEPYWSVLTSEEFMSENITATMDRFYASGANDVKKLLGGLTRNGIDASGFRRALDFGCGVGRLALALASRAAEVVGVDISPSHLKIARDRASQTRVDNVDFRAIQRIEDLDQFSGFDLITSYIVIQHNPPPIQAAIVERLLRALAPGGYAILQIPTYLEHATKFSVKEYLENKQPPMEMNALPQPIIFDIIDASGCVPVEVQEDFAIGALSGLSHVFTIKKK